MKKLWNFKWMTDSYCKMRRVIGVLLMRSFNRRRMIIIWTSSLPVIKRIHLSIICRYVFCFMRRTTWRWRIRMLISATKGSGRLKDCTSSFNKRMVRATGFWWRIWRCHSQSSLRNTPAFTPFLANLFLRGGLKKKAQICKVKTKYRRSSHKYGMKLPHSIQEALAIDEENGISLWLDANVKKIHNVQAAFEEIKHVPVEVWKNAKILPGFQEIKCHMISDKSFKLL